MSRRQSVVAGYSTEKEYLLLLLLRGRELIYLRGRVLPSVGAGLSLANKASSANVTSASASCPFLP